jgi:hypothetical protein
MPPVNRYTRIIEKVFLANYRRGASRVEFTREDLQQAAGELGIRLPKNLGDLVYSFRYRTALPESVVNRCPAGRRWIIRGAGPARYRFVASTFATVQPSTSLVQTKIPDATPGVIARYALSDEQALLAKLRYYRLIDLFTGVVCHSLQSHLRTTVADIGQIETDELYIGVDKRGAQFVFPVQAKGGRDQLNVVQIEQDVAMCQAKFASLLCRPIGAQFMRDDQIALFEFEASAEEIRVSCERHYLLVPPEQISESDLAAYRARPDGP